MPTVTPGEAFERSERCPLHKGGEGEMRLLRVCSIKRYVRSRASTVVERLERLRQLRIPPGMARLV